MILKKIILLLSLLPCFYQSSSQDIHFSQFFEAPLWRNPSLAGIFSGDVRVQAVYRDQWNNITNAYRTGSVNAEIKMPVGKVNDYVTTGLQVLYDRAGSIGWTTTHVLPALNYHKSLSSRQNRYLSMGFMGGWVQRRFDPSKATTNSQYDGGGLGENFLHTQYSYIDGSVGASLNSTIGDDPNNNFFVGAAYHHFHRPRNSFYRNAAIELHPKWVYSAGLRMGITRNAYITVQADHSRQGGFSETVAGGMVGFKLGDDTENPRYSIHVGAFMRWNDALIPVVKLEFVPFSASFSYDANISKLTPASHGHGGFEISLSYTGYRKEKGNYLLCPKF